MNKQQIERILQEHEVTGEWRDDTFFIPLPFASSAAVLEGHQQNEATIRAIPELATVVRGIYSNLSFATGDYTCVRCDVGSKVVLAEGASVDGARYIPYVHKYIVRQPWQRAMLKAEGCDTLEEALETALYWMNNPSFWVNALAVRRSDGVMVAWTEESYLPDLLNQIAKNGAEPPR